MKRSMIVTGDAFVLPLLTNEPFDTLSSSLVLFLFSTRFHVLFSCFLLKEFEFPVSFRRTQLAATPSFLHSLPRFADSFAALSCTLITSRFELISRHRYEPRASMLLRLGREMLALYQSREKYIA